MSTELAPGQAVTFQGLSATVVAYYAAGRIAPYACVHVEYAATGSRETVAADAVRPAPPEVELTVDGVITAVTRAPGMDAALEVMAGVRSRALLLDIADQLYVDDPEGHASAWLRKAIAAEARA